MTDSPAQDPDNRESGGRHEEGRRSFFVWTMRAAMALISLGLVIPLAGYVISPALKRRERPWIDVGAVDDLPEGRPKQLEYVTTGRDGYMETRILKAVWAVKSGNGEITVYSPLCTHLGCGYTWNGAAGRFECPCHLSRFNVEGEVIGGPAPRPLDRLPLKTENGRLLIMYKEFKAGLPRPVEL
jgi:menaquinol-cytochrome c reductase iron-sulfur subunit